MGSTAPTPALIVVRMAVLGAATLAEVVEPLRPLLSVVADGDADLAALEAAAEVLEEPLIFDDLLILGTQQLDPPMKAAARIADVCAPFAHERDRLRERAERIVALQAGPGRLDLSARRAKRQRD